MITIHLTPEQARLLRNALLCVLNDFEPESDELQIATNVAEVIQIELRPR